MVHIATNFDEVADEIRPISPGVYRCVIDDATVEPTKKGDGEKVVVKLRIDDEGNPEHGRTQYDHLGLKNPIGLKQCARAAGIAVGAGGLNTEDLIGQTVQVRIKSRTYKDPDSGEMRETSSVDEYLIPV